MPRLEAAPCPTDFHIHAQTETRYELRMRYNASQNQVARWAKESGATLIVRDRKTPQPPPPGFRETAEQTPVISTLAVRLSKSEATVARWFREVGVLSEVQKRKLGERAPRKSRAKPVHLLLPKPTSFGSAPAALIPPRDDTPIGEAADFLRRKGWVVFRARTLRATANNDDWIVGRLTLPVGEMVALAEKGGFQRREMM